MNKRKREDNKLYARTRKMAIERDGGLCVLCHSVATDVHHIVYRSRGGTSELSNLACLCRDCHNAAHGVAWETAKEMIERKLNSGN